MFFLTSLCFLLFLSLGQKFTSAESVLTTPDQTSSNKELSNSVALAGWCAFDIRGCYRETEKAYQCKAYQHRLCNCPKPAENATFCTEEFQHPHEPAFQQLIRNREEQRLCAQRHPQTCPVLEQLIGWPSPVGRDVLPSLIGWCAWSLWGAWSASCGEAQRIRQRRCLCGGSKETTESERVKHCNDKIWEQMSESRSTDEWSCPRKPGWCTWSQWSQERCSVCEDTNSENIRTRQCACPKVDETYNVTCEGEAMQTCKSCSSNENALSSSTLAIILFVLLLATVAVSCIICDRYTALCTIRIKKNESCDAKEEMLACELEQNTESGLDANNLYHSNVHVQITNEELHDDADL